MPKKKTTRVKVKPELLTPEMEELLTRYWVVVLSVWRGAMEQPAAQAAIRKKESVGWACAMARMLGEHLVGQGKDLKECLLRAAEELVNRAEELEE